MGFGATQGFTPRLAATWTTLAIRIGAKAKPSTANITTSVTTAVS